jgi:hypothetical protein
VIAYPVIVENKPLLTRLSYPRTKESLTLRLELFVEGSNHVEGPDEACAHNDPLAVRFLARQRGDVRTCRIAHVDNGQLEKWKLTSENTFNGKP